MDDAVTILVVEDDPAIQAIVEEALSDGGFETAIIASGEEAITLLKGGQKYRAVVSDINLVGRLDGWEVARAAREADPVMPIIYMTGTHGEEWASKGVPNSLLLAKPSGAACDSAFQSAQHGPASCVDGVRPPQLAASFI